MAPWIDVAHSELLESVQKRAIRIAYADVDYRTSLIVAGIEVGSVASLSSKRLRLSQYGSLENPGIILVKRCCTLSISDLSFW